MASFAPGTSQQYMNDYYRRVGPSLGGSGPEMSRPPMARPDSRNSAAASGGRSSPYGQPSNRPFQGTIPPVVPQQQSPDMSAYGPSRSAGMRWNGSEWRTPQTSRAQPRQPPSQGTPYGQPAIPEPGIRQPPRSQPAQPTFGVYGPGTSPEYMAQYPDAGIGRGYQTQPPSVMPGGGAGNLAYSPPDQRPQPFTTSVRGPDGNQYDPSQFFPMRDAFIQNINDARSSFAANPSAGRPQMDMGRMWGQAGDMVQQGYQNPLAGLFGGGNVMPRPPMMIGFGQESLDRIAMPRPVSPAGLGAEGEDGTGRQPPDAPWRQGRGPGYRTTKAWQ